MDNFTFPSADRRFATLGVTAALHVLLVLGWLAVRQPAPRQPDPRRMGVQWLHVPPPVSVPGAPATPRHHAHAGSGRSAALPPLPTLPIMPVPTAQPDTATAPTPLPAAQAATGPTVREMLDRARHDLGPILKDLKKENKGLIMAPPDSPQLRLRKGIEHAAEMAPNHFWEAPKTAELINNTGDGARRTRVITGNGTYCVTERAPTTSIDMIEKHGKIRLTNCPDHETPSNPQEWRTDRD